MVKNQFNTRSVFSYYFLLVLCFSTIGNYSFSNALSYGITDRLYVSPKQNYLVVLKDTQITFYTIKGEEVASIIANKEWEYITEVKFSHDEKWLIAKSEESHLLNLVRLKDFQVVKEFHHTEKIFDYGFTPNGKGFYSAYQDGKFRIFDLKYGKLSLKIHTESFSPFFDAVYSQDGKLLALATSDSFVRVYSTKNYKLIHKINSGWRKVYRINFSSKGKTLFIGRDNTLTEFSLKKGELLNKFECAFQITLIENLESKYCILVGCSNRVYILSEKGLMFEQQLVFKGEAIKTEEKSGYLIISSKYYGSYVYGLESDKGFQRLLDEPIGSLCLIDSSPPYLLTLKGSGFEKLPLKAIK